MNTTPQSMSDLPELPEPAFRHFKATSPEDGQYSAAQLREYGRLCRATAEQAGKVEGWLIEETTGGTRWYCGAGDATQTFGEGGAAWEEMLCQVWTRDSLKAVRFARKADAERMMRALGFDDPKHFAATEHIWIATAKENVS